ncbi:WYL domain-containing protein [Salmonella enterica subsp. enterica serovar Panama]|nr:WYL domain-containing protein [Salmonella enterica]EDC9312461.1 WYL domain-containing protein [Salmonella enterica subsp. enterica serovar Panama]
MPQTERRHERLADRLTQIIRRLFAGENLNMRHLAEEFGVSVRTLRRDLRERLTGLDLEYNDGHCRLVTADSAGQRERSGLTLARQSVMEALFPGLDLRLAGALLDETEHSPCCIWPPVALTAGSFTGIFSHLVTAINRRNRISLLAKGQRCECLAPYRLICLERNWYLTGELWNDIAVFPLAEIQNVAVLADTYTRNETISRLTRHPNFINALPHYRFIRDLLATFKSGPFPNGADE